MADSPSFNQPESVTVTLQAACAYLGLIDDATPEEKMLILPHHHQGHASPSTTPRLSRQGSKGRSTEHLINLLVEDTKMRRWSGSWASPDDHWGPRPEGLLKSSSSNLSQETLPPSTGLKRSNKSMDLSGMLESGGDEDMSHATSIRDMVAGAAAKCRVCATRLSFQPDFRFAAVVIFVASIVAGVVVGSRMDGLQGACVGASLGSVIGSTVSLGLWLVRRASRKECRRSSTSSVSSSSSTVIAY